MHPISSSILARLDFAGAATAESHAWRNLLPPEPWIEAVEDRPTEFGDYSRFCLENGIATAPALVVRARKPHQQTRPVAILGITERIALRAFSDAVLAGVDPLDRSSRAYEAFISGPIIAAFTRNGRVNLAEAADKYVIESDIASYYEYVDHAELLSELQLRTLDVELPKHLISLLTEIQARPVGLPQLIDTSDELSEVYIRIVERQLKRRGLGVWRYNDDFRMIADGYDAAQGVLEALADEAAGVGLVLNQPKTKVVKFANYFRKNWSETPHEGDIEFRPELLKVYNEYGVLGDDELASEAHAIWDRLRLDKQDPDHLSIADLVGEDLGDVKHALAILIKQRDPYGLDEVVELFEYAPYLAHRVGSYLVTLADDGQQIGSYWDEIVDRSRYFNAWQKAWLAHIARVAGLIVGSPGRKAWLKLQRADGDPYLRAEATLALAPLGVPSFDEVDHALRREPLPLLPWYALSAKTLPNVSAGRIQALRDSNGLVDLLCD